MKAIVTGATGMIGWNLIEYLVEKEVQVLAIVNPDSKRKNCILRNEYVTIVESDLENIGSLQIKTNYDYFFHLAWRGTHGKEREDLYLQQKNVNEALEMVDFAYKVGCKVFVGAGSQAEYGTYSNTKLDGNSVANPQTGYGIGKYLAGLITRKRCEQLGIRHNWVRIFSVYGPGDGMHTMVMSGIKDLLNKNTPNYTPAEQQWDYLYVKDAVEALYLVAIYGLSNKIYCLGSGKTRKLQEYIYDIRNVVDNSAKINIGALPYYNHQVMYLCADIKELQKDTGFEPKTSFVNGIEETVAWLKEKILNEKN